MTKYIPLEKLRKITNARKVTLPVAADLREYVAQIPFLPYDQGQEGSCTANAECGAYVINRKIAGLPDFAPSREFVYFCEREAELPPGQKLTDSGADVADGCKVAEKIGICPECDWVYNDKSFNTPPSNWNKVLQDAAPHKIKSYKTVSFADVKRCIAEKKPVLVALVLYESFESEQVAQTGVVPMPADGEQQIGGHETCVVGYDDEKQVLVVLNSWGSGWGDQGYFYLPYDYASNPDLAPQFIVFEI